MPHLNAFKKELAFKLVYYGPGCSGKTTNLVHIHRTLADDHRGALVTLDTEEERTLFFDFFPMDLGRVDGYSLRFNMYTVPGQNYYDASRRLILDGADGVVFVADSNPERLEENLESFARLEENLRSYAVEPRSLPLVLQYNKRDCDSPIPLGTLEKLLAISAVPVVEAVAISGAGVIETVRSVSRMVIERFQL